MRKAFLNLLLACLSVILVLGVLEAGARLRARLIDRGVLAPSFIPPALPAAGSPVSLAHMIRLSRNPRRIYELRPGLSVSFQGGHVTTDERGLRRPSPLHLDREAGRIVGIGDSVMFGQGVDDDDTYLAVLGRRLAAGAGGQRWQIANTAVPGYNTVMEIEALRDAGLAFDPHVVVIEFVGNDLSLPNFIREPEPVWSLDRSFLAAFLRQRLEDRAQRLRAAPAEQSLAWQRMVVAPPEPTHPGEFASTPASAPAAYRDMVGWEAYEGAMQSLAALAERRRFTVVWMLLVPGRQPLQDQAKALAASLGFVVVDAEHEVRRYLVEHGLPDYFRSPLAQAPDDGHPTPLGHQLAARALEQAIRRLPAAARGRRNAAAPDR